MPGKSPVYQKKQSMPLDVEQFFDANETLPLLENKNEQEPVSILRDPVRWLRVLSSSYSWRLLAMVVCTNHLLKGFVAGGGDEGLVGKPADFILSDLGATAGRLQVLKAAAIAPWALKPVVALLSDAFPIMGYRKMPYVIITTAMAIAAALCLGTGQAATTSGVVLCLFFCFLQVASVDVLVEAKRSEEVKEKVKLGPDFFMFTWLGINAAQVASICVLGPVIQYLGPRASYFIAVPFMALVLWPTLGNFLGEKPVPVEDAGKFQLVKQHPVLFALTLVIGVLVLSLTTATFVLPQERMVSLSLVLTMVVLVCFSAFIRREIAGPVIFYFILGLLSMNIEGAMFYFYTDSTQEYPAGPHFSPYFYTTGIGASTFLGIMVGFLTGGELFSSWSYRNILIVTTTLRAAAQLGMVPVLLRWTVRFGVPDSVWILPFVALDNIFMAWRWIPKQVMGAHLTPKGVEATAVGLNAGTYNMATILSSYLGGALLDFLSVKPTGADGEGRSFTNLWQAQVIIALTPLIALLLVPVLVPSKKQTEALLVEHPESATHGSAFELMARGRGD